MSRPTVRCYWSDGAFAYLRTRHSADGLVARGAGGWVPLSAIASEGAQADAGAADILGARQERVVRLHGNAPTREAMAGGVKEAVAQGARRDALAAQTPAMELSGELGLFVRTGRPTSDACWRATVEPRYQGFRSRAAERSVASLAAGGDRSPVRFPPAV